MVPSTYSVRGDATRRHTSARHAAVDGDSVIQRVVDVISIVVDVITEYCHRAAAEAARVHGIRRSCRAACARLVASDCARRDHIRI